MGIYCVFPVCREDEFEEVGSSGEEVEDEDRVSSKESVKKGDGLVGGSSAKGRETCADEKAEEMGKNGSFKEEKNDDGPR